jgi:hypothetical protein
VAVIQRKVLAQICQIEESIDTAEHMIRRHMIVGVEGVKQSVLVAAALSHHAGARHSRWQRITRHLDHAADDCRWQTAPLLSELFELFANP